MAAARPVGVAPSPHRMVHASGRWYLVAYDLDRNDWRSYRADRMTPKTPTGPRITPASSSPHQPRRWPPGYQRASGPSHQAISTPAFWRPAPQSPQLLAAYLAAMDLDFHVDTHAAPELAAAITKLAARYTAATQQVPTSTTT